MRFRIMNLASRLFAAFSVFVVSLDCHAYVDPGTGSIFLQLIFGGVAGLLVAGKLFWHRILDFVGLGKKNSGDGD